MNVTHIISAGRVYKEQLCQLKGHEVIVECMSKCSLPPSFSLCTSLLHKLGTDNPSYSEALQLALTTLLPSRVPSATTAPYSPYTASDISLLACHAAAQTLCLLLSPSSPPSLLPIPALTNPVLSLLEVPNLAIHAEAAELIDILVRRDYLREEVIRDLVAMMREEKGGLPMKQHHHVYINNVSLIKTANISKSDSSSNLMRGIELETSGSRSHRTNSPGSPKTNLTNSPPGNTHKRSGSGDSQPVLNSPRLHRRAESLDSDSEGKVSNSPRIGAVSSSLRHSSTDLMSLVNTSTTDGLGELSLNSAPVRLSTSRRISSNDLLSLDQPLSARRLTKRASLNALPPVRSGEFFSIASQEALNKDTSSKDSMSREVTNSPTNANLLPGSHSPRLSLNNSRNR